MQVKQLLAPITQISGVGPEIYKRLRVLGIDRIIDALFHFPSNIIHRAFLDTPPLTIPTEDVILQAIPLKITPTYKWSLLSPKSPLRIKVDTVLGHIDLLYFQGKPSYYLSLYKENIPLTIMGKLSINKGRFTIIHPEIIPPQEISHYQTQPVYPSTQGLSQKKLRNIITQALRLLSSIPDWLPKNLLGKHSWPSLPDPFYQIHNPLREEDLHPQSPARLRVAFDEILAHQVQIKLVRTQLESSRGFAHHIHQVQHQTLLHLLPFQLTPDQHKAISDINDDMAQTKPMLRLLQGDVGSGKTIVALFALLNAAGNEHIGCLMVPTEILARQHFASMSSFCEKMGVPIYCLTAQNPTREKREILKNMLSGKGMIIIGTQALLFQEPQALANMSCLIVDEQHRFGVEQRLALIKGDILPDCLLMSATPIPRTMVLTLMGDIQVSDLRQKPAHRISIQTSVMSKNKLDDLLKGLEDMIHKGNKAYWVCPLIEESDTLKATDAQTRFEFLKKYFPQISIGLIHGSMDSKTRDSTLQQFKNNQIKILVATTVIEVGIDVPDATILIVENAERFGLSQLHQLRGRVGRSHQKSYCIFIYGEKLTDSSIKRLQILKSCSDGFALAEADLQLRDGGNILGTQQSGKYAYKCFEIQHHLHLVPAAVKLAQSIHIPDFYFLSKLFCHQTENENTNIIAAG